MSKEKKEERKVVFRRIGGRIIPIAIGGGVVHQGAKQVSTGIRSAAGVQRVYHGTSSAKAASIKKTGLQGKLGGAVTFTSNHPIMRQGLANRNRGLAFVTTRKATAKQYGKFATYASNKGGGSIPIESEVLKNRIAIFGRPGKILKFDVPAGKLRVDPENEALRKGRAMIGQKISFAEELAIRDRYATPFISKRRIVGNLGFRKESALMVKRIGKNLKINRLGALKGFGRVGVGLGLIAGGGLYIKKQFE